MKSVSLLFVAMAFVCAIGMAQSNDTHQIAPKSDSQALQRDSFVRDSQTRMASADAKIEKLRTRMNALPAVSPERETLKMTVSEYRGLRESVEKNFRDVENASARDWTGYKDKLNASLDKLEEVAGSSALAE